jgi:hypothetical protein
MKCLICGNEFENRQKFAYHINNMHNINIKEYKLKYKPDKDVTLLECPICGKYNMKQLTQHLTDIHKITKDEFLIQYPDTKLWIDEISEHCSRAQSIGMDVFRNNLKQNPHFYDEMYHKRREKVDYSKFAEKVRNTRIMRGTNLKMSARVKHMWADADYRKMQSEKAKQQHANGLTEIIVKNSGKKRYPLTLNNVTHNMRSTWEVQLGKYLYEHNIKFLYEPFAIKYTYNEKERVYYPDFLIVSSELVIEVKPQNLCNNDMVIAKKLATESMGYKFIFITENELSHLDDIQFE